jgi:hypothetical protein
MIFASANLLRPRVMYPTTPDRIFQSVAAAKNSKKDSKKTRKGMIHIKNMIENIRII